MAGDGGGGAGGDGGGDAHAQPYDRMPGCRARLKRDLNGIWQQAVPSSPVIWQHAHSE